MNIWEDGENLRKVLEEVYAKPPEKLSKLTTLYTDLTLEKLTEVLKEVYKDQPKRKDTDLKAYGNDKFEELIDDEFRKLIAEQFKNEQA